MASYLAEEDVVALDEHPAVYSADAALAVSTAQINQSACETNLCCQPSGFLKQSEIGGCRVATVLFL